MSGVTDSLVGAWVSGKDTSPVFENYEIIQELPQGGQAIVYKAVHKPTKTHVAIKILLPTLMASTRARYYFEREAEVIARLDHPNIVKIRDSGIIHGQYFFVMEFIKGQPLYRYVEAQNLSFRERIILFKKICEAVTYAHQQGIIHRDLKSGNVLIDERGEPHILDFGLAKAIGMGELDRKDAMPTITGQWSGSLSNMSPEQAAAKPELIDVRTDVYALGMMLYHILTGQDAYDVSGPDFGCSEEYPGGRTGQAEQNHPQIRPRCRGDSSRGACQRQGPTIPVRRESSKRYRKLACWPSNQRPVNQHAIPDAQGHRPAPLCGRRRRPFAGYHLIIFFCEL